MDGQCPSAAQADRRPSPSGSPRHPDPLREQRRPQVGRLRALRQPAQADGEWCLELTTRLREDPGGDPVIVLVVATTRSVFPAPNAITSPARQFGTAAWSVGGSAGAPSSCSSLKVKLPIRSSLPMSAETERPTLTVPTGDELDAVTRGSEEIAARSYRGLCGTTWSGPAGAGPDSGLSVSLV